MKSISKKIIFSVLALNTYLACAGTIGASCDIDDLEKPCGRFAWNIEAGALDMEAEYRTIPYSTDRTEDPLTGADQSTFPMKPFHGWGFYINGSLFIENNRDIYADFYYLNTHKEGVHSLGVDGFVMGGLAPNWVAANLELGQTRNITSVNDLRLFVSIAYAWFRVNTWYNAYIAETRDYPIGSVTRAAFGDSEVKFNGIGPRVGFNLYNPSANTSWMNGIRLYAKGAVGYLFGRTKSRFFYSNLGFYPESKNRAVAELDVKLGVDYTPELFKHYVTFDAGWQGIEYLSSINRSSGGRADIFFQGIYFGAKWLGDMM